MSLGAHINRPQRVRDRRLGEILFPGADRVMSEIITETGQWEPAELTWLSRHIEPGMTCVDVGANVGYFACWMSRLTGPRGSVVAIEPRPDLLPLLRRNIAQLAYPNVTVVPKAAGASCDTVRLFLNERNHGDSRAFDPRLTTGGGTHVDHGFAESPAWTDVAGVTVDSLFPDRPVHVVLTDTQGWDHQVLRGMRQTILRHQPVILTEFVPQWVSDLGEDPADVLEEYRSWGYRLSSPDLDLEESPDGSTVLAAIRESSRYFANIALIPERAAQPSSPSPRSASILDTDAEEWRRILMTVKAADCVSHIPRVDEAGEVITVGESRAQVMHNGVLIEEGCYYGQWMTEIIRGLRGIHEPQEEAAFAAVLDRLAADGQTSPTMIELGSYWSYYSLWFLTAFPEGSTVCVEPDPHHLEVGRRNYLLNGKTGVFRQGAVGPGSRDHVDLVLESTGRLEQVPAASLDAIMRENGLDRVDILLADIQGAEVDLLSEARPLLERGLVRFVVVSTHDLSISGSATTHQAVLRLVDECGGAVVAEHSVAESFSGDGLVVAAFDPTDADFRVALPHNRSSDSLFGEWEPRYEALREQAAQLATDLSAADAKLAALQSAHAGVLNSRSWRWSAPWRTLKTRLPDRQR